ncbi:MAG: DNA polymerase [Pseudomonadota bacterium]
MNAVLETAVQSTLDDRLNRANTQRADVPAPARSILHIDLETYSEADIRKTGGYYYARHASTQVLMVAWAFDSEPVQIVDLTTAKSGSQSVEWVRFREALTDPAIIKYAHNAAFEIEILSNVLKVPLQIPQWRCTMIMAQCMSLPGALAKAGAVLGLKADQAKDKAGSNLIRLFCLPRKPTKHKPWTRTTVNHEPEKWQQFMDYCRQDVVAEREIHRRMQAFDLPEHEWALWHLDQKINRNGLPIDMELVEAAISLDQQIREDLLLEAQLLTGLDNPNSRDQQLAFLKTQGIEPKSLDKTAVAGLLAQDDLSPSARRLLEIRRDVSLSSVKKYEALARATCDDGRLRGAFQFAGAGRTWRWAGRIFQPQNLPRGPSDEEVLQQQISCVKRRDIEAINLLWGSVGEVLKGLCRSAVAAPPGKELVVADLSSIETVMLAWAAECPVLMGVLREGLDQYKHFGTLFLEKPYDEITKAERQLCKPPSLGCGYFLGGWGLVEYAKQYGVQLKAKDAFRAVDVYRSTYVGVPQFWDNVDKAFRDAICSQGGEQFWVGRFAFFRQGPTVRIQLPSGRCLTYIRPDIREMPFTYRDRDGKSHTTVKQTITYEGAEGYNWKRISTHPGKITENIVQAIARDVLAEGLMRADQCEDLTFDLIGHVHDEGISLNDPDPRNREVLEQLLAVNPGWCRDAPLEAHGYVGPIYRKD